MTTSEKRTSILSFPPDDIQRVVRIGRGQHTISEISKLLGDQTKHARIVFDHQDGLSLLRRADRQSRGAAPPFAATTSLAVGFTAG
jgi:hypothetical protein